MTSLAMGRTPTAEDKHHSRQRGSIACITLTACTVILMLASAVPAHAVDSDFSGSWIIDLCSPRERKQKAACGFATFRLFQKGDRITGEHSFATAGGGRLNEDGSVTGVVIGKTAVLVVTSARNGAIMLGKATLEGTALRWTTLEEIKAGEPAGDALILEKGLLRRETQQ
jgi:hypothetical protein